MIYTIKNNELQEVSKLDEGGVYFVDNTNIEILNDYGLNIVLTYCENTNVRYESYLDHDFFLLPKTITAEEDEFISIYRNKEYTLLIGDKKSFIDFLKRDAKDVEVVSSGYIIQRLLKDISIQTYKEVVAVENKALELEHQVVHQPMEIDASKEILYFRKVLLYMKRDFHNVLDVLETLLENDNEFFNEADVKRFAIEEDRLNRNYNDIISLLEYVNEIRETYQAAVDNHANDIMKLFTIISAIFLPLGLLAGWYGMNFLGMPELAWEHGYPLVIVLSLLIVVGCLWYFKKKKWL